MTKLGIWVKGGESMSQPFAYFEIRDTDKPYRMVDMFQRVGYVEVENDGKTYFIPWYNIGTIEVIRDAS